MHVRMKYWTNVRFQFSIPDKHDLYVHTILLLATVIIATVMLTSCMLCARSYVMQFYVVVELQLIASVKYSNPRLGSCGARGVQIVNNLIQIPSNMHHGEYRERERETWGGGSLCHRLVIFKSSSTTNYQNRLSTNLMSRLVHMHSYCTTLYVPSSKSYVNTVRWRDAICCWNLSANKQKPAAVY